MTQIVIHSVIMLHMAGIGKINYFPFCWGPPQRRLAVPRPTLKTTGLDHFGQLQEVTKLPLAYTLYLTKVTQIHLELYVDEQYADMMKQYFARGFQTQKPIQTKDSGLDKIVLERCRKVAAV